MGYAPANLLTGGRVAVPAGQQRSAQVFDLSDVHFFISDTWKATSKLTLDYVCASTYPV